MTRHLRDAIENRITAHRAALRGGSLACNADAPTSLRTTSHRKLRREASNTRLLAFVFDFKRCIEYFRDTLAESSILLRNEPNQSNARQFPQALFECRGAGDGHKNVRAPSETTLASDRPPRNDHLQKSGQTKDCNYL
jgi:hypothetical protein